MMQESGRLSGRADRLSILLVEDDELVRSSTAEMIRELGHAVRESACAEDALHLLRDAAYDVLVADVGLPGMSGTVFAAEARAIQNSIGIVFATGSDRVSGGESDGGGPVLLRKPYDIEELTAALAKARAQRR